MFAADYSEVTACTALQPWAEGAAAYCGAGTNSVKKCQALLVKIMPRRELGLKQVNNQSSSW